MMKSISLYLPGALLVLGAACSWFIGTPQPTPLPRPLHVSVPAEIMGIEGVDVPIDSSEEVRSGVTEYLNRAYSVGTDENPMQFYVGYHATQQGEHRMHSPSVCLPGAGWTPVASEIISVPLDTGKVNVNRYILQRDSHRILVYYWFQGRGRVTAGEAELKMRSLLDALLTSRDEETLVRIVVPMPAGDESAVMVGSTGLTADELAAQFASQVIPVLEHALPAPP